MAILPGELDRKRGSLIGLAVGDALGASVEFEMPGMFEEVTDYRGGGPYNLQPGEWTDDTSMALALADSLAEAGWDIHDQAERYLAWWLQGKYSVNGRAFDIGNTTLSALQRFRECRDARRSADPSPNASGNGSIMRLAPVPMRYSDLLAGNVGDLVERAIESSLPTHASPQCLSACVYMTLVLAGLFRGLAREEVLDPAWKPMVEARRIFPFHEEIAEVADGSFRHARPPEIVGSGYVVKSLEAALWAFHNAANFREAVLRGANLGDDADTTAAISGQFAGARWGESGIPLEWREGLARRDLIEKGLKGLGLGV